jgi:drug/metabolite transporter (DMT)-like permease
LSASIAVAFGLALASTTLTSLAYLREHDAAASMPALSMRRPLHSLGLLLSDRGWMLGFAMESSGFLLYAAALALAPLALVQSIVAGGIGLLAYLTYRMGDRRPLGRRRIAGSLFSVLGLVALAVSLARGTSEGHSGSDAAVLLWIGGTAVLALAVIVVGRRTLGIAVANALAGGLCFSIGDISTKLATQGGARIAFVVTLIAGYTLGTTLLQLGYQAGAALTVAGLATLLTNVLPILAGTIVLEEPVPSGALGTLRVLAFVAVTLGAVLLARPDAPAGEAKAQPATRSELAEG